MATMASLNARDDFVVSAERLRATIVAALTASGATDADAAEQADILVEGDLRDHHSHGVRRLSVLVGRLRNGLIASGVEPVLTWLTDAVLMVDGRRGFGPVVARTTIDALVDRAETTGVALGAISNSNHVGMLAPYVERIAARGQIGIGLTTSEALVHPWGSAKAMLGTNPIGVAIPTPGDPLVLDMSTASVSMGKILDHVASGRPIPPGWAVDETGASTTDPAAAARGAISPFGGPKGYALGITLEALVAVLTSTAFGTGVRGTLDVDHVATKGDVFVAVSLERLGLDGVLSRLESYLDDVRASSSGPDSPVSVPGDRARLTRELRMAGGIPLHRQVWEEAVALAGGSARGRADPQGGTA